MKKYFSLSGLTLKNKTLIILFILSLFMSSPDVIFNLINSRWTEVSLAYFVCTSLLLSPIAFFHKNLKTYLIILLPFGLFVLVSLTCIILFNVNLTFDVFLVILNTTVQESVELLKSYYAFIIITVAVYLIGYLYLMKRISTTINLKKSFLMSLTGIGFLAITPIIRPGNQTYFKQAKLNIAEFFPGSIYYMSKLFYNQLTIEKVFLENTKNFRFNASSKSNLGQKELYILVIGETSRYDHWNLNGYTKPTSPRLNCLKQQIVSFSNVSSGAYLTEYSVPMIVTRASAQNYGRHYTEKSIVSLFKEAGFKTYWLSNQFDNGNIEIHANEADVHISYSTPYEATKNTHYDLEMVDSLKSILNKNEKKTFIVLHTLGSHYDYDARYPDSFKRFNPTARSVSAKPTDFSKKSFLINSYDNSILYTDTVLDSIINLVKERKAAAWVSYTSDHGEELFDDSRRLSQHGFPVPSKYVAHVPWFIWTSKEYQESFPKVIVQLQANKNKAIGSQSYFYTLASLGNITFTGQDDSKSLTSNAFKEQPRFMLGGNSLYYNVEDFTKPIKKDLIY